MDEQPAMTEPAFEQMDASELGEMRRELLRILNAADPNPNWVGGEDVCERIRRLCRDGVIPEPIGDFMHVVRKCRNRAEYEGLVLDGMEARAIRSVWAAIEDWRSHQETGALAMSRTRDLREDWRHERH